MTSPSRPGVARRLLLGWALPVGVIVAGAAWLAPVVHGWALDLGWVSQRPEKHVSGFLKVFRRLLLIPLVGLVFWRLRPWRDGSLHSFGLLGPPVRARPIAVAFLATAALGAGLAGAFLALGWFVPEPGATLGGAWRPLLTRLLLGGLVGVLEEYFFRGWMQRRLARGAGAARAALLVAVIFALLHAFKPSSLRASVEPTALGALEALGQWLQAAFDPVAFGPTFLGLFLFSLVLGAAYARTGTLWTAVAIHAAAVWVAYGHEEFTDLGVLPGWAGGRRMVDGLPAWGLLAGALWVLRPRRGGTREAAGEARSK